MIARHRPDGQAGRRRRSRRPRRPKAAQGRSDKKVKGGRVTAFGEGVLGPGRERSRTDERRNQPRDRQAPPDADGQEEAADLPDRRGRQPVAARRTVHRGRRHLRAPHGAVLGRGRQRQGARLAGQGRAADRDRAQAARDLRCLGAVRVEPPPEQPSAPRVRPGRQKPSGGGTASSNKAPARRAAAGPSKAKEEAGGRRGDRRRRGCAETEGWERDDRHRQQPVRRAGLQRAAPVGFRRRRIGDETTTRTSARGRARRPRRGRRRGARRRGGDRRADGSAEAGDGPRAGPATLARSKKTTSATASPAGRPGRCSSTSPARSWTNPKA